MRHTPYGPIPDRLLCVSFPRSGQHLLSACWMQYFNMSREANFCEYYSCCKTYPCSAPDKDAFWHKTHDTPIEKVKIPADAPVIVGIREPYAALLSARKLQLAVRQDMFRDFRDLIDHRVRQYGAFLDKWVLPSSPVAFIWDYSDLVINFKDRFSRLLTSITPNIRVDETKIAQIQEGVLQNSSAVKFYHKKTDYEFHSEEMEDYVNQKIGAKYKQALEIILGRLS